MRDLVERRAILLVNGNMARIGEDNAQVCMHFIFQMLHRQMQHQMHLPEAERPRVALIADEAGYLLSRNVVRQIATHRAAGLDVAIGIQYLGQLGAGAESGSVTEEIRKGVTNLLQSRFLFRLSDPRDADEVSRIAMALVSTMTQQDPDSRLYRRVGPEVMLNIENYFCLCSWIASGARISSFIGQTFEMPRPARRWAEEHLARLRAAVGTPPSDFVRTTAQLTDPEQLLAALSGRAQHAADEPATHRSGRGAGGRRSAASRPEVAMDRAQFQYNGSSPRSRPAATLTSTARRCACSADPTREGSSRTRRRGSPRPPRCVNSRWSIG